MSRIGQKPIVIPAKVKIAVDGNTVRVEGPKGKLHFDLPEKIAARLDKDSLLVANEGSSRQHKALHGLTRSIIANHVIGVNEGFKKALEIQGVGFKAAVQGQKLSLNLGFSHPINYEIPAGVKVTVTDNTNVLVEGIDKQLVGAVAADIRRYYPPEPYKGKGVRYAGEQVRRKEGKTAQSK
jgi:large subunit ribosomal protein L6